MTRKSGLVRVAFVNKYLYPNPIITYGCRLVFLSEYYAMNWKLKTDIYIHIQLLILFTIVVLH